MMNGYTLEETALPFLMSAAQYGLHRGRKVFVCIVLLYVKTGSGCSKLTTSESLVNKALNFQMHYTVELLWLETFGTMKIHVCSRQK